jgi:transcriptional regulator with XRE-family HTH domain
MSTLGKRVRLARMRRGWQQKDLAQRASLSQKYMSQIEQDKVDPRASIITRLARTLGVTTDTLLVKFPGEEQDAELTA